MRVGILVLFVILASGCVGTSMNAAEIAACVNATHTQLIDIPNCNTTETCVQEWNQLVSIPTFSHLPISESTQKIQHHIIQAWTSMRHAHEELIKAELACEKGDLIGVIQKGTPAAGNIQVALKATEEGQWEWIELLQTSAERASKEEWTRIKDTEGYDDYTRILEILHDLSTQGKTTLIGKKWDESQEYYDTIAHQLTQNPLPSKTFDWGDVFSWYDTGIKMVFPEKKQSILWFSTIWKSALQNLTKTKSQNMALTLLKSIQGDEMMQHLEIYHSPKNGIFIEGLKLVADLETQWQKEETQEKDKIIQLKKRLGEQKQKWNETTNTWSTNKIAVEKLFPYFEAYNVANPTPLVKNQGGWDNLEPILLLSEQDAVEKTKPLGIRIEKIRTIEKQLNDWEQLTQEYETNTQTLIGACEQLGDQLELDPLTCEDLLYQLKATPTLQENEKLNNIGLSFCAEQINQLQEVMGEETYTPEQFIHEFGDAAQSACESMNESLQNQYWNTPLNAEWVELAQVVKEKWTSIQTAQLTYPELFQLDKKETEKIQKSIEIPDQAISVEEVQTKIGELEETLDLLNQIILHGMQNQIDTQSWNVTSPQPVEIGKQSAEAMFQIDNPFGQTILIEGELKLPKPIPEFVIENQLDEEALALTNIELPILGQTITGSGEGTWIDIHEQTKTTTLWGDIAEQETILTLSSHATTEQAKWQWKLPPGVKKETITAQHDDKMIPFTFNPTIEGSITLRETNEIIILSYQREGIIQSSLQLTGKQETENTVTSTYTLQLTNLLDEEVNTTVSSGLIPPPTLTYTMLVFSENGQKSPFVVGPLGEIILENVSIPAKGIRTYSLLLSQEKTDGKPFVQDTLEHALSELVDNDNLNIAAAAEKLWNKVKNNTNPDAWPGLVNEYLALQDSQVQKPAAMEQEVEPKNPILSDIQKMNEEIQEIVILLDETRVKMSEYATAISITCTKLQEVSYFCPIDDMSIRAWKKELDTTEKEIALQKKRIENEKTTIEQLINDQEKRRKYTETWSLRQNNVEHALAEMKMTATQLLSETKATGETDSRENIQNALAKGDEALEKKEYGKVIFVTKNLRSFFQSENKISGLISIPWQGWPLIGIIAIMGGIIIHREWKKKKTVPKPLKPLPMHGTKTIPSRAQRGNVGLTLPHTRGEDQ